MISLLLLPPIQALVLLLLWRRPRLQFYASLTGAALLFGCAVHLLATVNRDGIQVLAVGGWAPPLGIALVVDRLAAALCVAATLAGLAAVLASRAGHDRQPDHPAWHPLTHLLLWAVCGAFRAGDLFNLYVWFEVMLMSSFVLITLGGGRARMEGAVKYVALNLVSSALFLSGCGLVYGATGTLNFADIARALPSAGPMPPAMVGAAGCLLAAFLLKAGAFPFYSWLPASYPTTGPATVALFSGLLTKVGAYAVLRFTSTVVPLGNLPQGPMLMVIAVVTMLAGVAAAATQMDLRRILSIHIVSQIGYVLLGLAIGGAAGLAAAVFFMLHLIPVKSGLFLAAGVAEAAGGSGDVRRLGGLGARPFLYAAFLLGAASLAGLPPFSGFFAKLGMIRCAFSAGAWLAGAAALGTGFLTLYSMVKIHREVFAKPAPQPPAPTPGAGWAYAGLGLLTAAGLLLALAAGPVGAWCREVGEELALRTPYLHAVWRTF